MLPCMSGPPVHTPSFGPGGCRVDPIGVREVVILYSALEMAGDAPANEGSGGWGRIYAAARNDSQAEPLPHHRPAQAQADVLNPTFSPRPVHANGRGATPRRTNVPPPTVRGELRAREQRSHERVGGFWEGLGSTPQTCMACRGRKRPEGREGDEPPTTLPAHAAVKEHTPASDLVSVLWACSTTPGRPLGLLDDAVASRRLPQVKSWGRATMCRLRPTPRALARGQTVTSRNGRCNPRRGAKHRIASARGGIGVLVGVLDGRASGHVRPNRTDAGQRRSHGRQ